MYNQLTFTNTAAYDQYHLVSDMIHNRHAPIKKSQSHALVLSWKLNKTLKFPIDSYDTVMVYI